MRTGADAAVFAATPRWCSVVSTIGTPVDITAQELRLEALFRTDDETATRWRALPAAGG